LRCGGLLCLVLVLACGSGACGADAPAAGYQFVKDKTQLYAYDLSQQVDWKSAGDSLAYTSTVGWRFSLTPVVVGPDRCELSVVLLHVQASQTGPGSSHAIDSSLPVDRNGRDDPLLGHLLALDGAILTVVVDPRTGVVTAVRGGEEIVKRINQRFPAAVDGDPPPLDASSTLAYGSASLARLWSELLAMPTAGSTTQTVALTGPVAGTMERRWQGTHYTLGLPAGTEHIDGTLLQDPTPVSVTLSALTGSGDAVLTNGLPGSCRGDMSFILTLSALTQPVVQHHQLTWSLRQLPR
jgi:hypothetical protein